LRQKILVLQPERLHMRWQLRSIGRIIQKLLHMGNTKAIKFCGIRLFLIWYQILNTNKTHVEELIFQKLVHGFDTFHSSTQLGGAIINTSIGIDMVNAEAQKVFNQSGASGSSEAGNALARSIYPFEITPIIPQQPNEQQPQSQQQQQSTLSQSQQQQQQQQQGAGASGMNTDSQLGGGQPLPSQSMQPGLNTTAGGQQPSQSQSQQQQSQQPNAGINSIYNMTAEMLKKMLECMQQDVSVAFEVLFNIKLFEFIRVIKNFFLTVLFY
jgi:hypothetical protein